MKVFQTLSELPDGHKQILMDTISVRREDVRQALMSETNTISEAVLTDFDWQVKVSRLANEKLWSRLRDYSFDSPFEFEPAKFYCTIFKRGGNSTLFLL